MASDNPFTAMALRYLSHRARSTAQVKAYLVRRGATADQIEQSMHRLDEFNVLNDRQYAKDLAQSLLKRGKGAALIKQSLKHAGLSEDDITVALESIPPDAAESQLYKLVLKYIDQRNLSNSLKDKAKLYRFLTSRGFKTDQIRRAIDSIPSF